MSSSAISGKYKIVVHKGNPDKPTRVVDWFSNMITNQGLDSLGTQSVSTMFTHCKVGTGSSTPAFTNVGLDNPIATVTNFSAETYGVEELAPYYTWRRFTYTFTPGMAIGNVSEISIGWAANNNSAFSRCLVTEEGSPITITVLPDDFLTIYYEIRLQPNLSDVTGTVVIDGVTHNFTGRACGINMGEWIGQGIGYYPIGSLYYVGVKDGNIGTLFTYPSAVESQTIVATSLGNLTYAPYVLGSYYRDVTFLLAVGQANLTDFIKSMVIAINQGVFQYEFTPPIEKTANNTLTMTFRFSWGRAS